MSDQPLGPETVPADPAAAPRSPSGSSPRSALSRAPVIPHFATRRCPRAPRSWCSLLPPPTRWRRPPTARQQPRPGGCAARRPSGHIPANPAKPGSGHKPEPRPPLDHCPGRNCRSGREHRKRRRGQLRRLRRFRARARRAGAGTGPGRCHGCHRAAAADRHTRYRCSRCRGRHAHRSRRGAGDRPQRPAATETRRDSRCHRRPRPGLRPSPSRGSSRPLGPGCSTKYKPSVTDAWRLRTALTDLGLGPMTSADPGPGGSSLTVVSLSSDRRALALGPQLAVFAASLWDPYHAGRRSTAGLQSGGGAARRRRYPVIAETVEPVAGRPRR